MSRICLDMLRSRAARREELTGETLAEMTSQRIRRGEARPEPSSVSAERRVDDAFLAASRKGDFAEPLDVLGPEVVFRFDRHRDGEPGSERVTGRDAVAAAVLERGSPFARLAERAVIGDRPGLVIRGPPGIVAASRFTICDGRVTEIDVTSLPDALARLRL